MRLHLKRKVRLLFVACLGAAWCAAAIVHIRAKTRCFDAALWKSWNQAFLVPTELSVRSRMIEYLLKTHDFKGWPRTKIMRLLGTPNKSEGVHEGVTYLLGMEPGGEVALDHQYLWFTFDSSDQVNEYGLVVD